MENLPLRLYRHKKTKEIVAAQMHDDPFANNSNIKIYYVFNGIFDGTFNQKTFEEQYEPFSSYAFTLPEMGSDEWAVFMLKLGHKLRRKEWQPHTSYVQLINGFICCEHGLKLDFRLYNDKGWDVYKSNSY